MSMMLLQPSKVDVGMFGISEGKVERKDCAQGRTKSKHPHSVNWAQLMVGIWPKNGGLSCSIGTDTPKCVKESCI